jgi:hypothetical protein
LLAARAFSGTVESMSDMTTTRLLRRGHLAVSVADFDLLTEVSTELVPTSAIVLVRLADVADVLAGQLGVRPTKRYCKRLAKHLPASLADVEGLHATWEHAQALKVSGSQPSALTSRLAGRLVRAQLLLTYALAAELAATRGRTVADVLDSVEI